MGNCLKRNPQPPQIPSESEIKKLDPEKQELASKKQNPIDTSIVNIEIKKDISKEISEKDINPTLYFIYSGRASSLVDDAYYLILKYLNINFHEIIFEKLDMKNSNISIHLNKLQNNKLPCLIVDSEIFFQEDIIKYSIELKKNNELMGKTNEDSIQIKQFLKELMDESIKIDELLNKFEKYLKDKIYLLNYLSIADFFLFPKLKILIINSELFKIIHKFPSLNQFIMNFELELINNEKSFTDSTKTPPKALFLENSIINSLFVSKVSDFNHTDSVIEIDVSKVMNRKYGSLLSKKASKENVS